MAYLTKVGGVYYLRKKIQGKIVFSKSTNTSVWKIADNMRKEFESDEEEAMKKFVPVLCSSWRDEYLDIALKRSKTKSKNTQDTIKYSFNKFIKEAGDKLIHEYTIKELDKFLLSFNSPETAKKYRRTLSAAFGRAIKWRHLKTNLWTETIELQDTEVDIKFVEKETFHKILEAAPNDVYRDVIFWAALTGMRRAELRKIKPVDVSLDNEIIKVVSTNVAPTKSKSTRFVELHSALIPIYEKYKEQEYLFINPETKKQYSLRTLTEEFTRINKKLNLPKGTGLHALRSTYGVWLLAEETNMKFITQMLGHSSVAVTEKYYAKFINTKSTGTVNRIKI